MNLSTCLDGLLTSVSLKRVVGSITGRGKRELMDKSSLFCAFPKTV